VAQNSVTSPLRKVACIRFTHLALLRESVSGCNQVFFSQRVSPLVQAEVTLAGELVELFLDAVNLFLRQANVSQTRFGDTLTGFEEGVQLLVACAGYASTHQLSHCVSTRHGVGEACRRRRTTQKRTADFHCHSVSVNLLWNPRSEEH